MKPRMEIVQVNAQDVAGGAERIAVMLDVGLKKRGIGAQLLVGKKWSSGSTARELPNDSRSKRWHAFWDRIQNGATRRNWFGIPRIASAIKDLAYPGAVVGRENFHFPQSRRLLSYCDPLPDILHFHNLHGDYFDLRYLAQLSHKVPVVITLHDSWMLTGHCGHSVDCDRWQTGCGSCPDLTIYPSIRRDATHYNWRRKASIFAASRLHIVTPSEWLLNRVNKSMLWPAVVSAQTIPNGVDLKVFHPRCKFASRQELGISQDAKVILFAANGIRANPFKDFATLRSGLEILGKTSPFPILALAVGDQPHRETIGSVELRFVAFEKDPAVMASYYNSSDVYVHAARVDTFPNSVLEAMACGVPVVASNVGGIPEQVISLEHGADHATGILVPAGNADAISSAILQLIGDDDLRQQLGKNAAVVAKQQFSLEQQTSRYVSLYEMILRLDSKRPASSGERV